MINGNITETGRHDYTSERFQKAFEFLKRDDLLSFEPGTSVALCDGATALIQAYTTYPQDERKFEAHEKYTDVQYVIEGEELVGVVPAKGLEAEAAYDEKDDIVFFKTPAAYGGVVLRAGDYVVLTPEDAHRPCCRIDGPCAMRKIVVKVRV